MLISSAFVKTGDDAKRQSLVPLTVESWNQLFQEIKGFAELFDHSEDEPMAA